MTLGLPAEIGKRLGILGGTFDPVHNGHLAVAEAAQKAFSLDAVVFVPAALPPHKLDYNISSFKDRLAMLKLAIAGHPGFFVSGLEGERLGPSFSVDTLTALRRELAGGTELFFIIGIDAFAEIATWKEYSVLPYLARFVVVNRPDQRMEQVESLVGRNFSGFGFDWKAGCWQSRDGDARIYPLTMEPVPISSTMIRQRLQKGGSIADMVPREVGSFVRNHRLYS